MLCLSCFLCMLPVVMQLQHKKVSTRADLNSVLHWLDLSQLLLVLICLYLDLLSSQGPSFMCDRIHMPGRPCSGHGIIGFSNAQLLCSHG